MILDDLRHWITTRLAPWLNEQGVLDVPAFSLEEPPAGILGDVACNIALLLAKPLRKAPRLVAQSLQSVFAKDDVLVADVQIAGAGFLNFTLTAQRLVRDVHAAVQAPAQFGRNGKWAATKVLIEFVSANPTGPLHVGHGRGAALGDSLALILAHLGCAVTREYYINDAGNQIQLLGQSLLARALESEGQPFTMPEEGYHGDYIKPLAAEYAQVTPLERRTPESATAFALERLQKKIETDLADFGVRFDSWFSEASVVKKGLVEKHVQALRSRGFVRDYDDAIWFVKPEESQEENPDKDRVLKRRDGRWTYFATDVAYHADKFERGFDQLIDIWGADHHGYVARVKSSMEALGHDPKKLHVLLYQLVSLTRGGVPVSMSKRTGDFVTLREVLDEVGKDACRFFFALRGPNTAMDFDLELAKKHTNDNPVYYVQYAHARICSIFRQAPAVTGVPDLSLLKEKEERDLMRRLAFFPHTLTLCANEDSPHPLANYLLSLCRQFHHFYDHHRVLGDDPALTHARLTLLKAVKNILAQGLSLLGVSAPESM